MPAPLILFVYNRVNHTKQTLKAVSENILAKDTDLFLFSDGAKGENDRLKVAQVRRYIDEFEEDNVFKNVYIEKASCNNGLANSIINGVSKVIRKYGKVIVLEDDLVTSPYFLKFMNDCLDFYEENDKVWSIGGATYEMNSLKNYPHSVYAIWRGSSWGWATWEDRWEKVDWKMTDYISFMKDRKRKKVFQKKCGEDIIIGLKKQMLGWTDSWAIRWCYQQFKEDMVSICPVQSLIKNIGFDGSGIHSDSYDRFHILMEVQRWQYILENIDVDERIINEFCRYYKRTFLTRIYDFITIEVEIIKRILKL